MEHCYADSISTPIIMSLYAKLSVIPALFQPTWEALFSHLPLDHRWRLLLLQPINLLAALITSPYWLFSAYSVLYIPTRNGNRRCLAFEPPSASQPPGLDIKPRPLHIDIHGGGFIGGIPEMNARWCRYLSVRTGAVVISLTYRLAPLHSFPAAHDDIDDLITWVISHSPQFNVDVSLLTLGGSSVGGSLALSTSQYLQSSSNPHGVIPKALVAFCPVVDFRLRPGDKPKPPNFPEPDPLRFLLPLYDAYAGSERQRYWQNPRLHPMLAKKEDLPKSMFFVFAGVDILAHEQTKFIERLRRDANDGGSTEEVEWRLESRTWPNGFHGWLELPKWVLEQERIEAFDFSVAFIREVHQKHGFHFESIMNIR
ncbi:alpha/beta-hydrolase [Corynespora cassiicola Philippines]|uniref:Alpha/beta-hydrolase n=1 Tax=Corynespora cassiicola Philippines TaxID=1448308 RepID=A0A2T2NGQ0_CORCC|nr:alpha/beta-hydrolase [Corynespora cassiicola Philippines]